MNLQETFESAESVRVKAVIHTTIVEVKVQVLRTDLSRPEKLSAHEMQLEPMPQAEFRELVLMLEAFSKMRGVPVNVEARTAPTIFTGGRNVRN